MVLAAALAVVLPVAVEHRGHLHVLLDNVVGVEPGGDGGGPAKPEPVKIAPPALRASTVGITKALDHGVQSELAARRALV